MSYLYLYHVYVIPLKKVPSKHSKRLLNNSKGENDDTLNRTCNTTRTCESIMVIIF